ncbi:hypothetical protein K439DRAFT_1632889 [Ramaria rubella]|nr:hypothetical protein K439DRAFT_1632889 [Ramaria rubella]
MEGKAKKIHCRDERGTVMAIPWLRDGGMQMFGQRYEWRNNKEVARERTR